MLETWAADGTPMQRLGDRVAKQFGVATIGWNYTGADKSGTIVDPRWLEWPANDLMTFVITGTFDPTAGPVRFSLSGSTLTWSFYKDDAFSWTRPNTTFVYGII